jgi:hypothetical protein
VDAGVHKVKLNLMKPKLFSALTLALLSSCSSLSSVTTIGANNSFVLGNNPHGFYNVKLKNISSQSIVVYQKTLADSVHSFTTVKPRETVHVYANKNTALIIENKSNSEAKVALHVGGDTNLSMGYKN